MADFKSKFKGGPPTTDKSAEDLIALGYRRTSNAFGLVSRIDREDWLEVLAEKMGRSPADFIVRSGPDIGKPSPMWADQYRRCYSKDTLTVDQVTIRLIPGS